MALRQLVINKKLEGLASEKDALDFEALKLRKKNLEEAIVEAETDEDMELVEAELDEVEVEETKLKDIQAELEGKIAKLHEELDKLEETIPETVEEPVEEEREGKNSMEDIKLETRNQINAFVRKEDRNFTTVEGALLIPKEILRPQMEFVEKLDLSKLVNVVKVNHGAGSMPLIGHTDEVMATVAELEQNPKLANPAIRNVDYKVDTYRGYIPVSQELIDDANYDITGLVRDEIVNQEINTKNAKILEALKGATAKTAEGVDGLKTLINTELPRKYGRVAIMSASLYNALDLVKDKNGRYLLQDDATAGTGKNLLGMKIEVLDDEVIGTATGDMVGFFGDAKRAITVYDRVQTTVKWIDHMVYGQLLAGFTRFQVKTTDADAGFYVTYTAPIEA